MPYKASKMGDPAQKTGFGLLSHQSHVPGMLSCNQSLSPSKPNIYFQFSLIIIDLPTWFRMNIQMSLKLLKNIQINHLVKQIK
jgi:hypothetical protein